MLVSPVAQHLKTVPTGASKTFYREFQAFFGDSDWEELSINGSLCPLGATHKGHMLPWEMRCISTWRYGSAGSLAALHRMLQRHLCTPEATRQCSADPER